MSRLSDEESAALVGRPWLSKVLRGEAYLIKYAPNNGSPLFLITTLETAYVECLTPSLMLRRADGCDINSNDAFGRRGLNRTQQMEAVAAKLEHTFKPGKAWNELELEDGLVDNDYSRVINFRSEEFLWTCKLELSGDEALGVLKDNLVAPLLGLVAAAKGSMGDVEALTKEIDSTAFAGHRKFGMLVSSTIETPTVQTAMQRWNQRQLLGPKLKKEELVQIRDTIEQDPSTSAESSEWQIVPSPTASERALRHRSSSTPLPSPSTSKPDLGQAAAEAALPPSDDDATEPESNAEEARSRASSVTVDEDDEAAVQPAQNRTTSRRSSRRAKETAIEPVKSPPMGASLDRKRSRSPSSSPDPTPDVAATDEPESSLSLDQQRVAELRSALRQPATSSQAANHSGSQTTSTTTKQPAYRGRGGAGGGRSKRGRSIW